MILQGPDDDRSVVVEGRELVALLVDVALLGAGLVVAQHRPQGLVLVVDLRRHQHEAVTGELRREPGDRSRLLVDLRIEEESRKAPGTHGADGGVDMGPHRSCRGVEVPELITNDHAFPFCEES
jgi:hypothetical protein